MGLLERVIWVPHKGTNKTKTTQQGHFLFVKECVRQRALSKHTGLRRPLSSIPDAGRDYISPHWWERDFRIGQLANWCEEEAASSGNRTLDRLEPFFLSFFLVL